MKINMNDHQFLSLVNHILENKEFCKIKQFSHHGTTRMTHSMRVSYYSYKIAKKLKLDHKVCAVSGLLHDFFLGQEDSTPIKFLKFQREHPKIAAKNAIKHFKINKKEINIIETHMFPFTKPSRYLEGWIISLVDKTVGTYEYGIKFKYQISVWSTVLLNVIRGGK